MDTKGNLLESYFLCLISPDRPWIGDSGAADITWMICVMMYQYFMVKTLSGVSKRVLLIYPESKVHVANMGSIWGRQDPGGPHVGPLNFAIWVFFICNYKLIIPNDIPMG